MSYVSKEKIIELFNVEDIEDVTDERVELIMQQTDDLIHSYLAQCETLTLPLDPVPKLIESIAVDIARWEVVSDGRIYDEVRRDGLKIRYDNALKLIGSIRDGTLSLFGVPTTSTREITINAPIRCFTHNTLNHY